MGALWKALGDEQKAPYVALALEDAERFSMEMANYVPSEGFEKDKDKVFELIKAYVSEDRGSNRSMPPNFCTEVHGQEATIRVYSLQRQCQT